MFNIENREHTKNDKNNTKTHMNNVLPNNVINSRNKNSSMYLHKSTPFELKSNLGWPCPQYSAASVVAVQYSKQAKERWWGSLKQAGVCVLVSTIIL